RSRSRERSGDHRRGCGPVTAASAGDADADADAPADADADADTDMIRIAMLVPRECDGWRLDHFLKHRIGRLSRTRIQGIIETQIALDGRRARSATVVHAGE